MTWVSVSTSSFKVIIIKTKSLINFGKNRWFFLRFRMHICPSFEHILVHLSPTRWYLLLLFLMLVKSSRVIWTDLLMCPMPYIVKKTPNYLLISSNNFSLRPKISRTESRKIFKKVHYFVKICHYLWHISFWWISM